MEQEPEQEAETLPQRDTQVVVEAPVEDEYGSGIGNEGKIVALEQDRRKNVSPERTY
jgi:hypothetical protein